MLNRGSSLQLQGNPRPPSLETAAGANVFRRRADEERLELDHLVQPLSHPTDQED